jgi:bifunctional non-homologous end joining protein LigD
VAFVVFDVLRVYGVDVMHEPYVDRRARLESLGLEGDHWATCPSWSEPAEEILEVCGAYGLEGVVAKRLTSWYLPGRRSRYWRKVKTIDWREVHAPLRHEH